MSTKIKYFIFGFIMAFAIEAGVITVLFYSFHVDDTMTFHEQQLASGKKIKITMCNFVWGVEHSDRNANKDSFAIEYVMSSPEETQEQQDQEALEVFELIRPISEQWKIPKAEMSVFPTLKRKGTYYIYLMKQENGGKWTFTRQTAKVHINDA